MPREAKDLVLDKPRESSPNPKTTRNLMFVVLDADGNEVSERFRSLKQASDIRRTIEGSRVSHVWV